MLSRYWLVTYYRSYPSFQFGALREDDKRQVWSTWLVTVCVCYYSGSPVIVWATLLALIFEFYVITIYVTYANLREL